MANKPMPEDTLPVSAASDDDRAHLRGRSRQEAQHWVSVEGQALQRRSLDLGFLHNSTITLNMLPNEIFVSIIRRAVSGEDTMAWITKTMGVCRHWRETIIRTPLLWTDIRLSGNMQFSALCLTRSSGATINWYVSEAHVRPPPLDWYSATGSLLALHHTRIKHMRIYLEATITPLVQLYWQLSTIALPVLVSMDLTAVAGLSTQWIPSYLPSLRRLSLHRLSVDVTHLPLSQLTSLDLNNVDLPSRSLASLLDVLKACTSLQRFVYEDTDDMPINELPVAADNRVSLPHIRHFCITATSAHTSSLLVHILLAKQTRVVLYPNDFHPPQDENHIPVLNTFLPRDSAYWPAMKDLTHIMVWWYGRDGLTIYADHETTEFWELRPWRSLDYVNLGTDTDELSPVPALVIEHLQIDWPYPSCTAEPLRAVVEELGVFFPVSAKTFVLRGYAEEIPTETWTRTLATFSAIEHFEIIAEADAMCSFPLALRPTSTGIPCPRLRELVLRYEAGAELRDSSWRMLDDLRVVLQERVGGGSRLQSLILQLDPPPEVEVFRLFRQSTLLTATGRWPPDFEEIQKELALFVGSLKISYRGPHDMDWQTIV